MAQTLRHGAAEIIRTLLVQLGLGTEPAATLGAWPAYSYAMPAEPDDLIAVYDQVGAVHGRFMVDGSYGRHQGIQVMVRGGVEADARLKADAIMTALAEDVHNTHVTVGGLDHVVVAVSRIGQVIAVGQEPGTGRHLFSVNGEAAVREV